MVFEFRALIVAYPPLGGVAFVSGQKCQKRIDSDQKGRKRRFLSLFLRFNPGKKSFTTISKMGGSANNKQTGVKKKNSFYYVKR